MNVHDAVGFLFCATYLKAKHRGWNDDAAMIYAAHMVYIAVIAFAVYVVYFGCFECVATPAPPQTGWLSLRC